MKVKNYKTGEIKECAERIWAEEAKEDRRK